ncbi:MAG: hypothetical protein ACP5NX_04325 [Candidatus Bilamarchaeaceae archaeon]
MMGKNGIGFKAKPVREFGELRGFTGGFGCEMPLLDKKAAALPEKPDTNGTGNARPKEAV